ncbi:hypothetical protein AX16_001541 [Volvariella volvacea WC 439]|nr:hypothetical protein AX16_001541 [Volvariella volvacea WC 439]
MFFYTTFTLVYLTSSVVFALPHAGHARSLKSTDNTRRGGFELPITRHVAPNRRLRRGDLSGSIGLGNNADLLYTVPIEIDDTVAAVNLDTGSSDLWLITDQCTTNTCRTANALRLPSDSVTPAGTDVQMFYGDSTTGTFARGTVGRATATIAGIAMDDQPYGAINDTNNVIVQFHTSGIFGLGFPSGSKIQEAVVTAESGPIDDTDDFLRATWTDGPLLSRISMTNALELPMFSITLQRNTIDIGGHGMLTVGRLPDGVDESSLTWVPVRLYEVEDGGLAPPNFAPNEVYPFRWEIDIDGVFLDGQRIPDSRIPATGGVDSRRTSALIDTGNSLLRGPKDVVDNILSRVSDTYNPSAADPIAELPCINPRTMAFQIGGKMFPVDPRDFIGQHRRGDVMTCVADNLVSTDAPSIGATFRWSLGDPFLRSNLVAFHYGNLTHPSVDPPRIGLLSLVPSNADELLVQAVNDAVNNGGNFEETLHFAPTASAAAADQVTVSPDFASIPTPTGSANVGPITPVAQPNPDNNNSDSDITGTNGGASGSNNNSGSGSDADSEAQQSGSTMLRPPILFSSPIANLGAFLMLLFALML